MNTLLVVVEGLIALVFLAICVPVIWEVWLIYKERER